MLRTSNAVEMWMYADVLRYQFNPTLIDGITAMLSGIISYSAENKKTQPKPCSIIDVLEYLIGSERISEIGIL